MGNASSERVLARYLLNPKGRVKTAGFPPFPPKDDTGSAGPAKREIPKDHEFQARALKPLAKALWASTVALGHALTAYRHLSRLKSATVSPDGLMGGRGYVMKLSEMRQKLYEASEALSSISDTIFDEINAPHWKPKLAQLDDNDKEDVARFVEEAQEVMENPEADAEEDIEKIESANDSEHEDNGDSEAGGESSDLPAGGDAFQAEIPTKETRTKQASRRGQAEQEWARQLYAGGFDAGLVDGSVLYVKANSSLPVSELSGGPRVDHLGPGTGQGEYGDFSEAETLSPPAGDWTADNRDYDYTSEWENEAARAATTGIPDSATDDTPTEAWDFGIGYGARGQGAGGYANPSGEGAGGKGVLGPHSGLPGAPAQSTGDTTHVVLDEATNRHAARLALYGKLPQDVAGEVARSDYYSGAKDNEVTVGTSDVPTPEDSRSEHGQRLLNTYYTSDDQQTDLSLYDFTTHTIRSPSSEYQGQNHQEPFAPDGEATR